MVQFCVVVRDRPSRSRASVKLTALGVKRVAAISFNVNDSFWFVPDRHVLQSSWLFIIFYSVVSSVCIFMSTHAGVSHLLTLFVSAGVCVCECPCVYVNIHADVRLYRHSARPNSSNTVYSFLSSDSFHHVSEEQAI